MPLSMVIESARSPLGPLEPSGSEQQSLSGLTGAAVAAVGPAGGAFEAGGGAAVRPDQMAGAEAAASTAARAKPIDAMPIF